MIKAEHPRLMARYSVWQNASLMGAADGLSDAARWLERGAFFGSIHGTLNHLLWADIMWLNRFEGLDLLPAREMSETARYTAEWSAYCEERGAVDTRMLAWADGLSDEELEGDFRFHSPALGIEKLLPKAMLVTHFFNHQTHHRGQAHAMLTAAGAQPEATDIPFMPSVG